MKIAVCFKIVPRWSRVLPGDWERFTPDIDLAYAGEEFNCFDESALALALRLKEARERESLPASCTAVTVGRRPPAPFVQTLYALGFDEVAVVEKKKAEFAPRDAARLLAGYIKKESFDLILTGSVAGMADSGTVPFWLAQFLKRPVFTEAQELEHTEQGLAVTRQEESGLWRYLVHCPLVLTVGNSFAVLQAPTLKNRLAVKDRKPRLLTPEPGAPQAGAKTLGFTRGYAGRSCRMLPQKNARELAHTLLEGKLLHTGGVQAEQAAPKSDFAFPKNTAVYRPQLYRGLPEESVFDQLAGDWFERGPDLAVLPHTPEGRLLATALAARTGAALFTEANLLGINNQRLLAQKRACAGGVCWKVSLPLPAVVTLPRLPKNFSRVTLSSGSKKPQWLAESVRLKPPPPAGLQSRPLAVLCGLGMGSAGACERARLLAQKLGAGFGLTRPAALEGWGTVDEIIGSSGAVISPEVCLVLGASGAGAFMAGLETAERIIAVNTDEQALIFKQADLGLTADASALVEAILEQL